MEIELKNKNIIKVDDLVSIPNYAKKINLTYNGVLLRIAKGKIQTLWISGTQFIIDKSEE